MPIFVNFMSKCLYKICYFFNMGWAPPPLFNGVKKNCKTGREEHPLHELLFVQVKFERIDLSRFKFKNLLKLENLRSDFLSPEENEWTIYRPSRGTPRILKEKVEKEDILGLPPINMAAVVRPWAGPVMQLDLGVVSCTNLVMNDPDKSQVPMVSIYAGFVTLAHSRALEDSDIPTLPYLINKIDAEGEEMTMKLPTNEQLHEAVEEMLTDSEDPQFKNNMDQVREILLHENQKELKGRLTELEQKDNENMSEVTNIKLLTFF